MRETKTGCIKLIDFGIARFFKSGQARDTSLLGTAGYAPPEQHGKGQTDARSDIYALGVTMHQLLTKYDPTTTPFNLPSPRALNKSIPAPLEKVIVTATELDANKRYQSAAEMRNALVSFVQPAMTPTQSASPVTGFPKTQSARSTPPLAVAFVVAVLAISATPGLIFFGMGAIGIICAVLMWLGKKWGRRIGIVYLAVGLVIVGFGELVGFFAARSYRGIKVSDETISSYIVMGLMGTFAFTLALFALLVVFRDDVLDFF